MEKQSEDIFQYALSTNAAWAGYKAHQNPSFFPKLASGQAPQILWIGCSDSRCPEATLLGLQPGDVFALRSIANVVTPNDVGTAACIQFAVTKVKVQHIMLCGHTSCGGCNAALSDDRVGGALDLWLAPLRAVRAAHAEELDAIADSSARAVRLAELNVEAGVGVLMTNMDVQEAIRDRGLQVHGCLYDLATGRLRDLGFGTSKGAAAPSKDGIVRGNHGTLVFSGGMATTSIR